MYNNNTTKTKKNKTFKQYKIRCQKLELYLIFIFAVYVYAQLSIGWFNMVDFLLDEQIN